MSTYNEYDDEEKSFFQKYGILICIGVLLLFGGGIGFCVYLFAGKMPPPRKPEEIRITLAPPPPPPPPPPKPPPPPPPVKQKMVEQTPPKPNEAKPVPHNAAPPSAPGPKASGPPSNDGIAGAGGGGGDGIGGGDGGGSRFGWYAAEVIDTVQRAMDENAKTREASFQLKVRIWADASGRITRATLSGTSGDPAVDDAIKNEVLVGLKLQEPPPQDMPMPIVMRISAKRQTSGHFAQQ